MRKMITAILIALYLIMFCSLIAAGCTTTEGEDNRRIIEGLLKAHEGIYFAPLTRVERGCISRAVVDTAAEMRLNPFLVLGVIRAESSARANAQNGDCCGLMQVSYGVWGPVLEREGIIKGQDDLFDIRYGIRAGCYVLRKYLDKHNGDTERALLSYSGYTRNKGRRYIKKACAYLLDENRIRGESNT